jgi:hypothetical protein
MKRYKHSIEECKEAPGSSDDETEIEGESYSPKNVEEEETTGEDDHREAFHESE